MLVSLSTQAEITTGLLNCVAMKNNDPSFQIKFNGSSVWLKLKGSTYNIPYTDYYVDGDGDKWERYDNNVLGVSTLLPNSNLVTIFSYKSSPPKGISGANCN